MTRLTLPAGAELALVLSNDAELGELNERYRGKTGPTDVLSFPVDEDELPEGFARVLGDVIISVAYAERSAAKAGHSRQDELRLLAVHGLLHLMGHEDESEAGAEAMRALEVELGVRESGA
jgi:probable rRNA maturation factor